MKRECSMSDRLRINNLKKRYRGQEKGEYALSDINLSFESGQLVAILGHNGAGKTTLLGSIGGSVKPTNGEIVWNDLNLIRYPQSARKITSAMPQIYAPIRGVTPINALVCVGMMSGMSKRESREKAENILERLNLTPIGKTSSENLSGGYRRLVSFGLALMRDTPILLLDEPTNDVDPLRRKLVWNVIQEEQQKNRLVLVVTHNLEEISKVSNRYIIFDKGKVAYDSQLIDREEHIWLLEVRVRNNSDVIKIKSYADKYEVSSNISNIISSSLRVVSFTGDKEVLTLLATDFFHCLETSSIEAVELVKYSSLLEVYKRITDG